MHTTDIKAFTHSHDVTGASTSLASGNPGGALLDALGLASLNKARKTAHTLDKLKDMKKLGKSADMCFVAGTLVVVEGEDGKQATKPIEDVKAGDRVWSRCDATGEQGFKPVLQTFVTHPVELVHLTYRRAAARTHGSAWRGAAREESGDGDADPDSKLVGTPNHPFWSVTRQAWVELGELYIGERLLLADGSEAVVESLQREYAPAVFDNWQLGQPVTGTLGTPTDPNTGTFTTYNFEVADWHTYFVTNANDATATWVHNTGRLCPVGMERAAEIYKARGDGFLDRLRARGVPEDQINMIHQRGNGVYDVGMAKDLRKTPVGGTQVHHAPGSRQAESVVGDWSGTNKVGNEPSMRLPTSEHEAVTAAQNAASAPGGARELLAQEARILRNNTNAPNSALRNLLDLNKAQHPWDYAKLD